MKLNTACVCIALAFASCVNNPADPEVSVWSLPDVAGVFVLNEGNYGDAAGARISFYVPQADTVFRSVVEATNEGDHLGDTADDFMLFRDKVYVLMSGSKSLKVFSVHTFHLEISAAFPGTTPCAMAIDSLRNCIYIARLFENSILVADLATLHVLDTIAVGANPQDLMLSNNRLFVCNSGFGFDRSVSVVNPDTRKVIDTLFVGLGPSGIAAGSDGRLWVVCSGRITMDETLPGSVCRIDPLVLAVTDSIAFAEPLGNTIVAGKNGVMFVVGSATGSYYGGPIHRISTSTLAVTPGFVQGVFYGAGVDDVTGDLYLGDAKNFMAPGVVSVYSDQGSLKKSFVAERGPSQFLFKR